MSGSAISQFEIVKMKFDILKKNNTTLESENRHLEEVAKLLRTRLDKTETSRIDLMNMFKERIEKHQSKVSSMENEITHLHNLLREKDVKIEELEATIEKQNDVIEKQISTIDNFKNEILLTKLTSKKKITLKKEKNNNYSHPVFLLKTQPKKSCLKTPFRWSTLEITKKSQSTITKESSTCPDKKRKLYCSNDNFEDIIDLESEEEN